MEAEIVQMGIRMFNGGPKACGTVRNPCLLNLVGHLYQVASFNVKLDDFGWFWITAACLQGI